jgi:Zn-dependent alcohol dehydrogenase
MGTKRVTEPNIVSDSLITPLAKINDAFDLMHDGKSI